MKFYHIDRIGTLANWMKIENTFSAPAGMDQELFEKLFPFGGSKWGSSILDSKGDTFDLLTTRDFCEPFISWNSLTHARFHTVFAETIIELVRSAYFPELPSRLSSFFAAYGLDSIALWKKKLAKENARVFEVEASKKPLFFDASLLPGGLFYPENAKTNTFLGVVPPMLLSVTYSYWKSLCNCAEASLSLETPEALLVPPVVIGRQVPPEELDVFLQEPLSQR